MDEEKFQDFVSNFHKWKQDKNIALFNFNDWNCGIWKSKDYIITALYVEKDVSSASIHILRKNESTYASSVMWREDDDVSFETLLHSFSLENILDKSKQLPKRWSGSYDDWLSEKINNLKRIVFEPFVYSGVKATVDFKLDNIYPTWRTRFYMECYQIPKDMPDVIYPQIYEEYNDIELEDYRTRFKLYDTCPKLEEARDPYLSYSG